MEEANQNAGVPLNTTYPGAGNSFIFNNNYPQVLYYIECLLLDCEERERRDNMWSVYYLFYLSFYWCKWFVNISLLYYFLSFFLYLSLFICIIFVFVNYYLLIYPSTSFLSRLFLRSSLVIGFHSFLQFSCPY